MNATGIKTVNDLFPRLWLKPEDLQGRKVTVTIASAEVRESRQRDGTNAMRLVLGFGRAQRRMICNKTQTLRLAELTRSPPFADWPAYSITLAPATAPNGKPTSAVATAE